MPESKVKNERNADVALLSGLTRRQLKELEEKEKTPAQKTAEAIIMILPLLCGCIAMPLRYNYDKPEKPRISRVFGYLARFSILFQTEKSSREVVIS